MPNSEAVRSLQKCLYQFKINSFAVRAPKASCRLNTKPEYRNKVLPDSGSARVMCHSQVISDIFRKSKMTPKVRCQFAPEIQMNCIFGAYAIEMQLQRQENRE